VLVLNEYAEALEIGRAAMADAQFDWAPDVCTIYTPASGTPDDYGDVAETETASDPTGCAYKAANAYERAQATPSGAYVTHVIELPATEETLAIQTSARIVVDARGTTPEMTFQVTGRLDNSRSMKLRLAATLQD
jgi:hypothetical protein